MDISTLGFTEIPAITCICFIVCKTLKTANICDKWIPIISAVIGGILAVIYQITNPDIGTDILTIIAIGIVSGWAATGLHQSIKQLKKEDETNNDK